MASKVPERALSVIWVMEIALTRFGCQRAEGTTLTMARARIAFPSRREKILIAVDAAPKENPAAPVHIQVLARALRDVPHYGFP